MGIGAQFLFAIFLTGLVPGSLRPVWSIGIGNVEYMRVSRDGKWLAMCTTIGCTIWDAASLEVVTTLPDARVLEFAPGASALVMDQGGQIQARAIPSGTIQTTVRDADDAVLVDLALSPNGKLLALLETILSKEPSEASIGSAQDGGLSIEYGGERQVATRSSLVLLSWPGLEWVVSREVAASLVPLNVTWSPDSRNVIVAGAGSDYMKVSAEGEYFARTQAMPYVYGFHKARSGDGHSLVRQVGFVDSARAFAVGQSGLGWHTPWTEVFVFTPKNGKRLWPKKGDPGGRQPPPEDLHWPLHAATSSTVIAVFSPYRPNIHLLDTKTGEPSGTVRQSRVAAIAVAPDARTLYVADPTRILQYSLSDRRMLIEKSLATVAIEAPVLSLAADGRGVVSLQDGSLREFDGASGGIGKLIAKLDRRPKALLSQDGTRMIVDDGDGMSWYAGATGASEGTSDSASSDTYAISCDGRRLAYGNRKRGVSILALPSGDRLGESLGEGDIIRFLAFSPDGAVVASLRQWSEEVELWSAADGKPLGKLTAPGPGISSANLLHDGTALVFSPDGRYLAAALWNGRGIALWELDEDESRATASRYLHANGVGHCLTLAFSPDSAVLACGEESGNISVFEPSEASAERFDAHRGPITSAQFIERSSGIDLVSASMDGTIACRRFPRPPSKGLGKEDGPPAGP